VEEDGKDKGKLGNKQKDMREENCDVRKKNNIQ
jgi:hypothetical protein